MCLCPVTIINPKKRLAFGVDKFLLQVPCGQCRECNSAKQDEWMLRTYYESLDTLDNGGFVLTDCLTYNDEHLPHLSLYDLGLKGSSFDFPCFCREDVRHFMVRLRSELTRLGYDYRKGLKYFLCSEYGSSESHTHRPHYHVAFFVTFDIDPFLFSKLIHKCWKRNGFTDGLPFKSKKYLLEKNHLILPGEHCTASISACIAYVCKYVTKDSYYQLEVDKRIDAVCRRAYGDEYMNVSEGVAYFKHIKHKANEFHLQSSHLGECAFKYCDKDTAVFDGYMRFPTTNGQSFVIVPTPMYFKRKLLYELRTGFRGNKTWQLTDFGEYVKRCRVESRIDSVRNFFIDWYSNLPDFEYKIVHDYLGARDFYDLARYIVYYKGAIVYSSKDSKPRFQDLDELIVNEPKEYIYNYTSREDLVSSGYRHLSFADYMKCYSDTRWPLHQFCETFTIDEFKSRWVIDENTFPCFHDFDKIFTIYAKTQYDKFLSSQKSDLQVSILTNKLKFLLTYA